MKNVKMKLVGVLMVLVLLMAACGGKSNGVVGSWAMEESGFEIVYKFEDGGKFSMSMSGVSVDGEYKVDGDKLTLIMADEEAVFDYKVDGNELKLSIEGEEALVMKKK